MEALHEIYPATFDRCYSALIASTSIANSYAATVDEIALYNKPDRQKILIDGAKKERKLSFYYLDC